MTREERYRSEAHRKAQWLAYEQHLAEMEELRALVHACEQAAHEVLVLRARLLDAQLDLRGSELAWRAIQLARGAELLDTFRDALRTIIREVIDSSLIVKQFKEKLKELPCEAIDWTKFDAEFRQTYPEFQSMLLESCPELTSLEMRICMLLQLKLVSADIARLLCLTVRSVEGHRRHIRRKLGGAHGKHAFDLLAAI